jgi:hypothetical protein
MAIQGIGDRATRELFRIYEGVFDLNPDLEDLRWRIEHCQVIHPDDLPRFAGLGVIASVRGIFATSDGPWVETRLGAERTRERGYQYRTLFESGAVVINGTDPPVEDISPIANFYRSVTRIMDDGSVFYPEQKMTREQALASYTVNPAYAGFEEDLKGTISVGKLADLTVLSRDIMTVPDDEILGTEVVHTIIDGEVRYTSHQQLSGDYVGQEPPGLTARMFAPGFVSTEYGELNAVFSDDGHEFYFSRRGIPGRPSAIMVTRRDDPYWTPPAAVGFDDRYSTIDLFVTADEQQMVFCSNRPHEQDGEPRRDHDFWVSQRDGDAWSEPALFAPAALSDFEDYYPIVASSGNLYFNSQRDGAGTNNIFRSSLEGGEYGTAEKLPEPINSEYREFDAYVSFDEDVIIFSSERPGGFGGSDIYVSFLGAGGAWTEPQNLGREVNSPTSEYGAMPSPDGHYLFFTTGRGGDEDIYWISMEVVDELSPFDNN